ncbi:MAG: phospholipase D family protein [Thermodesulfobacteriota bacterium]
MENTGYLKCFLLFCLFILLAGCTLPSIENRDASSALGEAEARATLLGKAIAPLAAEHPGKSGIYPLQHPHDAFAARMLLAKTAERTLDIQYYIWRRDISGTLLLKSLYEAAERGVRVRLLLDDIGTSGLDDELAALDSHPKIEVRLFNPFVVRYPKWLGFLTNFSRANRRMHNKSFTADNQATIAGGRNVGDAYFWAAEGLLFADLDVLCVGPVVDDVSTDFDRYWASDSSYPVGLILPPPEQDLRDHFSPLSLRLENDPAAESFMNAMGRSSFLHDLLEGSLAFEWAKTRMVSDDPAKGLGKADADGLLTHQLEEIIGLPDQDVALISPYFIPTAAGVDAFRKMTDRGVSVRIFTNSLDATDVLIAHAGYAKRRKEILKTGITLYEMRRVLPKAERTKGVGFFGSSASSLHAKTFAADCERVFVGSFNFDPRSAHLNTEMGLVIDSPSLARRIDRAFDETIPERSYEVRLNEDGHIYWLEQRGDRQIRHEREPNTGFWKRSAVYLLSLLPIEWLL